MKKLIGSALLGATIVGGVASIGAGAASADPWQPGVNQNDHRGDGRDHGRPNYHPVQYRTHGEDPGWRPGPVFHEGRWHQPVWDAGHHHWGFWLGPFWIPVG